MDLTKCYATLYSVSQGYFHIEPLTETLEHGLKNCLMKIPNDYVINGIHATRKEADDFIKLLIAKQKKAA